ncbi:MAG: DUF459 domain-containing protein [Deltaproteobacteria bacterium]|nr:DUF459 domain-containing protein [Deltaproteobacteria bacterium]
MLHLLAIATSIALATASGQPAGVAPACTVGARPPRALLLGDSNIHGSLGTELERALQALGYRTDRFGRPGSGLARPDYYDWLDEASALVSAADPDVVFFMAGGNDGQGLTPLGPGQRHVAYDDDERWDAEYAARVVELVSLLGAGERPVYFLSPTNRRPRTARERMGRVRRVQQRALAGLPEVAWIDMFPLTTDGAGRYLWRERDPQGHLQLLRASDGIHLTRSGGKVVGARLIRELIAEGLPIFGSDCPPQAPGSVMAPEGRQHPGRRQPPPAVEGRGGATGRDAPPPTLRARRGSRSSPPSGR